MSVSSDSTTSKITEVETGQSNFSAVVNIILTGIGVGMLGLPGAIAQAGYVLGFILLLACGLEGLLDTHLLRKCMNSCTRNYEDIGRDAFGYPGMMAVTVALNVALVGTGCLLMLLLGQNSVLLAPQISQTYWILIWTAVMLPLACLRTMKQVGYFSGTVGVAAVFVVLITIVIAGVQERVQTTTSVPYRAAPISVVGLGTTFSTLTFSYAVTSTTTTILQDMKHPEAQSKVLLIAFICLILLFLAASLGGYIGWGQELLHFDTIINAMAPVPGNNSAVATTCIVGILIVCATHYVVMMNPSCRIFEEWVGIKSNQIFRSVLLRSCLVAVTVLVAIFVPSFSALINLLGSICFSLIHNIYPSVFYLRLSSMKGEKIFGSPKWIATTLFLCVLMLISIIGSGFGVLAAIKELCA